MAASSAGFAAKGLEVMVGAAVFETIDDGAQLSRFRGFVAD
jgi:hypothetical protein